MLNYKEYESKYCAFQRIATSTEQPRVTPNTVAEGFPRYQQLFKEQQMILEEGLDLHALKEGVNLLRHGLDSVSVLSHFRNKDRYVYSNLSLPSS